MHIVATSIVKWWQNVLIQNSVGTFELPAKPFVCDPQKLSKLEIKNPGAGAEAVRLIEIYLKRN